MSSVVTQSDSAEPDLVELPPEPAVKSASRSGDVKLHAFWLILSAVVLLLSLIMEIKEQKEVTIPFTQIALPELCTFRRYTGLDCAGCGMTRCFIAIGHGEWRQAWSYNPAGVPLYAIMLFQLPFRAWQIFCLKTNRREIQMTRLGAGVMIAMAVFLIFQWLVRQLGFSF